MFFANFRWNGKASNGGNIKFIGTDDSNVWFGIDKGQTRVCSSIGSKPVKGFYDLLSSASGLEYMLAVGDIKTYEPYREPQTLTLQTPNGLPGVPVSKDGNYTDADGQQWVCDEVDLGRGKYGRTQFVCGRIYDPSDYSGDIGISHIPKGDDRSWGCKNGSLVYCMAGGSGWSKGLNDRIYVRSSSGSS